MGTVLYWIAANAYLFAYFDFGGASLGAIVSMYDYTMYVARPRGVRVAVARRVGDRPARGVRVAPGAPSRTRLKKKENRW